MKCPFCSDKLREIKSKSVFVDVCPNCRGIWFDSGEFVDFVRSLSESETISPEIPQLFKKREVHTLKTAKEKTKICPKCTLVMQGFNYAYDSNIFLDKCTNCGGIWTDAGEVQKIAKHLKMNPEITAIGKGLIKSDHTLDDLIELGEMMRHPAAAWAFFTAGIPVSDDTQRQKAPVVTISIITLCALVFAVQVIFGVNSENFFDTFGFIPGRYFDISLVTSLFLHVGLFHLIGNMWFLWIFGDNVEDKFGRLNFILFYFACGIAGNFAHALFNLDVSTPAVGASGAISGIMGAYLMLYPKARIRILVVIRTIQVPAFYYLGAWLLFQLMYGFLYGSIGLSGVAWFAHIGGFIFGAAVAAVKKSMVPANQENE